ncbi:MAG: tetratricopeptide repeat protein [Tepidisphaeraceae bacterium]
METSDWNEAERRVERAQELIEQRKWQEALDELRAATSINPYNSTWYFNIGVTLDEMGRLEEAAHAYRQALAIDSDDVQALQRLGCDLHDLGRFDQAISVLEKLQAVDATCEASYCGRIPAYTELGEHEKAEEMFYIARLYREHCPDCYYNMGVSLAQRGLHDKAIFCWNRALDGQECWPEAHVRIAESHWAKNELEQARRHYMLGLRQDPGNTGMLLDLSELLIEMQRWDEAGEKIRRAIELAPEDAPARCCHGRWLLRRDRLDDAASSLARALALDPACSGAHMHLAAVHLRRGETELARKHLRGELLLNPESPQLLMDLSNLLIDARDFRSASACLRRLVSAQPRNFGAWLNLGVAQFLRGRFADGLSACEQALRLDPRSVMARFNLALAHGQSAHYDAALAQVRDGLRHAPRDTTLQRLEFRLKVLRFRSRVARIVRRAVPIFGM